MISPPSSVANLKWLSKCLWLANGILSELSLGVCTYSTKNLELYRVANRATFRMILRGVFSLLLMQAINLSWRTPRFSGMVFSTFFSTRKATSFNANSLSWRICSALKKLFNAVCILSGLYIFPAFNRASSSSAVRSMLTTSSACSSTISGIRSLTSMPTTSCTISLSPSICWILTAVITLIPASSISMTSCQRFSFLLPSTLVWANSSTMTTSGWILRIDCKSISSISFPL